MVELLLPPVARARAGQAKAEVGRRTDRLEYAVVLLLRDLAHRADAAKLKTEVGAERGLRRLQHGALKAEKGISNAAHTVSGVALPLAVSAFKGSDGEDHGESEDGAPHRTLTSAFAAELAEAVRDRLDDGVSLDDALQTELGERAPVQLDPAPSSSSGGWLRPVLVTAGLALAANYAVQVVTGRSAWDHLCGLFRDEPDYPPVHGTRGAEMPNPDAPSKTTTRSPEEAPPGGDGSPAESPVW